MKKLVNIILSTLTVLQLNCSSNEKEVILPDDDNAYKSVYPDTIFHDEIELQLWSFKDTLNVKKYVLLRFFDSNVDNIPDLAVGYYLKSFDKKTGEYEIDSSKAPPVILKGRNLKFYYTMYFYNKDKKMYEKYFNLRELLR